MKATASLWLAALLICVRAQAGDVITLEQAYDRTLATSQSIQRAYWEIRKAQLEPWSALTRLGPTLSGNISVTTSHESSTVFNQPTGFGSASTINTGSAFTSASAGSGGTAGLTFQETLLDLTVIPAYRLGKLTAEAAKLTYRSTIRQGTVWSCAGIL